MMRCAARVDTLSPCVDAATLPVQQRTVCVLKPHASLRAVCPNLSSKSPPVLRRKVERSVLPFAEESGTVVNRAACAQGAGAPRALRAAAPPPARCPPSARPCVVAAAAALCSCRRRVASAAAAAGVAAVQPAPPKRWASTGLLPSGSSSDTSRTCKQRQCAERALRNREVGNPPCRG
jgi:hypothetical protein